MKILLDTQCWLWMEAEPERLNPQVRDLLLDPAHALYLSAASAWEISIKIAIGKLRLPSPPSAYLAERMGREKLRPLSIEHEHALLAGSLPPHHRDPFDRMLVAQALREKLTLLSADPIFARYEAAVLWADRESSR
ncbi:type II toxin-antitoxin system VapC family toxin [Methylacidimicrobium sp. B4]|uniref:type II toxin-antitoxin system VapC family toxin n=1 Tax=Methylacidimicrobium sp. B4 TaxID=2796139 RepID=UPI001A8D5242|nr:type II toxin-antitoxin system VapC family toxin [Methylacidimicrobium sp. B4]QSR84402.1 type II toxin-antitoxin system VapC family toxin [Methylacidimicrobium sp. B4]